MRTACDTAHVKSVLWLLLNMLPHVLGNSLQCGDVSLLTTCLAQKLNWRLQESGSCEREVKKRVQPGWNGWRKVSEVICDRRLPAKAKGKVYSTTVRPTMVYGVETMTVTKKQVEEMEVAEMKMLRFAMGMTRKDKIRNE